MNRGNLMECWEKSIENITQSDSNFTPTFADHHLLPEMNFNGHCLIKRIMLLSLKSSKSIFSKILFVI